MSVKINFAEQMHFGTLNKKAYAFVMPIIPPTRFGSELRRYPRLFSRMAVGFLPTHHQCTQEQTGNCAKPLEHGLKRGWATRGQRCATERMVSRIVCDGPPQQLSVCCAWRSIVPCQLEAGRLIIHLIMQVHTCGGAPC